MSFGQVMTNEKSPAIDRWEAKGNKSHKSAKRTAVSLSTEVLGYCRSSATSNRKSMLSTTTLAVSLLVIWLVFETTACQQNVARTRPPLKPLDDQTEVRALPANSSPQLKLAIEGAKDQVGKTTGYDPSYQKIDYPNGDVPIETGVCSDVIVRAFRKAGIDLQKDVHEDMKANFAAYPTRWGLSGPDSNIDHRRVPNLMTYFARRGKSLPPTGDSETFLPGDIVTWDLGC